MQWVAAGEMFGAAAEAHGGDGLTDHRWCLGEATCTPCMPVPCGSVVMQHGDGPRALRSGQSLARTTGAS